MSNYVMAIEETFWDSVAAIVRDSEHLEEATDRAISLAKPVVPNMDKEEITDGVWEMWNELSSKYAY